MWGPEVLHRRGARVVRRRQALVGLDLLRGLGQRDADLDDDPAPVGLLLGQPLRDLPVRVLRRVHGADRLGLFAGHGPIVGARQVTEEVPIWDVLGSLGLDHHR